MSSTTRPEILAAMKTHLVTTMAGVTAEQIVDYIPDDSKATSKPLYFIVPAKDTPLTKSGDKVRRFLVVFVGVILKVPGVGSDFEKLEEVWEPFHAALEIYSRDPVRSKAGDMRESEAGQDFISLALKKDRFVAATCGWQITFDRALGA